MQLVFSIQMAADLPEKYERNTGCFSVYQDITAGLDERNTYKPNLAII
jgi:hypothetical protein